MMYREMFATVAAKAQIKDAAAKKNAHLEHEPSKKYYLFQFDEKLTEVSPPGLTKVSFFLKSPTLHGIRILTYFLFKKSCNLIG